MSEQCLSESGECYADAGPSGLCQQHRDESATPIPMRIYDDWCKKHGIPTHDERLKINRPQQGPVLVAKP
jgi:hypothetical protein